MCLKPAFKCSAIICLVLACIRPAIAGAPSPCVKAVTSQNGNFLVITDMRIEPAEGNTGRVRQLSFQMFPRENFINAKDRMSAAATYWTDWTRWSVVLDAHDPDDKWFTWSCPLPLITDDGEFLVLLRGSPLLGGEAALRIYRRRDHQGDPVKEGPDHGVFIREVPLKEIWPADKVEANTSGTITRPNGSPGEHSSFPPTSGN